MITIVYVMGYSRSGSTILDIVLQQHDDVIGVGAAGELFDWLAHDRKCGCSLPLSECKFWQSVASRCPTTQPDQVSASARLQRSIESLVCFPALVLGIKREQVVKRYREQAEQLFGAISVVSGKKVIVDSSKTARLYTGRPLALFRHTRMAVKIIHLVRDGRGVVWSAMKSSGSPERRRHTEFRPFNFAGTLVSWILTNSLALLSARLLPDDAVLRVRYEDLCDETTGTLREIGEFIGLDMCPVIEKLESGRALSVGHNVGGNRVRFTAGLRFRPDYEWRDKLPNTYKRLYNVLALPLARQLGYR